MTNDDTRRAAALATSISEALTLLAGGAAADAAQVLEGALAGARQPDGDEALTHRCVAALQSMLREMPEATRTPADTQGLLGALIFAAHLGADGQALADVISPQELAVTLARILRNR